MTQLREYTLAYTQDKLIEKLYIFPSYWSPASLFLCMNEANVCKTSIRDRVSLVREYLYRDLFVWSHCHGYRLPVGAWWNHLVYINWWSGIKASVWFVILLALVCLNWHCRWIWSCVFTFSASVSRTLALTGFCYVCTGLGNYLYVEASPKTQGKKARLFSPEVGPETGPLCLKFSYQLEDEGTLRVLLRYPLQEETLLWALHGSQGSMWKEGRTILPRSPKEFQVNWDDLYKMITWDKKSILFIMRLICNYNVHLRFLFHFLEGGHWRHLWKDNHRPHLDW